MKTQLPLNFHLRDDARIENFCSGDNSHIVNNIMDAVDKAQEQMIFLWGQDGVGKTHLLQAACHRAIAKKHSAVYIPLRDIEMMSVELMQGLENTDLVCIDDVDMISGKEVWEESFFHLFNKIKDNQGKLFVSASSSPNALKLSLADLKSRLSSGITYQIKQLDDIQKLTAIQSKAKNKGLTLDNAVGKFLLSRCPRNIQELFIVLDKLDHASLAEQRRLTIPFVKQVLEL